MAYSNVHFIMAIFGLTAATQSVTGVNLNEAEPFFLAAFAVSLPGLFQAHLRLPVQKRIQKIIFRWQKKPYAFKDNGQIENEETGWWLKPTSDLYVVETKTKPASASELRENVEFINATTYNRLTALGAGSAMLFGSGHIHVDLKSGFGEDAQLLRDFIVDILNHPGLYLGPLVRDRFSSSDPRLFNMGSIRAVVERFDRGELQSAKALGAAFAEAGLARGISRGSAIAFSHRLPTLELRFPRAPRDGEEVALWAEMFKARLNYLQKNPGVALKPYKILRTPVDTYRQIKAYVTEAGLNWEPYRKMLPRRWQWLVGPIAELHKAECDDALSAGPVIP